MISEEALSGDASARARRKRSRGRDARRRLQAPPFSAQSVSNRNAPPGRENLIQIHEDSTKTVSAKHAAGNRTVMFILCSASRARATTSFAHERTRKSCARPTSLVEGGSEFPRPN